MKCSLNSILEHVHSNINTGTGEARPNHLKKGSSIMEVGKLMVVVKVVTVEMDGRLRILIIILELEKMEKMVVVAVVEVVNMMEG